jgi:hypothetical protein
MKWIHDGLIRRGQFLHHRRQRNASKANGRGLQKLSS